MAGWHFLATYAGIFLAVAIIVRAVASIVDSRSRRSTRERTRGKDVRKS